MSANLANVSAGFAKLHAEAKAGAELHLSRYLEAPSYLHAFRFEQYAEEMQLLAPRKDAVQRLARAWRK